MPFERQREVSRVKGLDILTAEMEVFSPVQKSPYGY